MRATKTPPKRRNRMIRGTLPAEAPRYLQIAADLRRAIAEGRYPVGAQLPTEHQLYKDLGVSRFTVREAIRMLTLAGLVRRKPRAGTIVVALPDDARYSQSIGSLRDLLQYAQTTSLRYAHIGRIKLSRTQARAVRAAPGDEWIYAVAIRRDRDGGKPIGVTRLFLNPALRGIERMLRRSHGAVYSLIEKQFGVRVERVEQVITSVMIDAQDSVNLEVPPGTPGLSIRRSYFDDHGRLLEHSDNVHPADRFSYRMELRR